MGRGWRGIFWRGWVAAGCGLLLGACATTATRGPEEARWQKVALGLCEDYPEESRSIGQARKDLEVAAACGAKVLRIAFGWDAMEPERGKYDWSFWDEFVRMATGEFGITLIPYVCYTPQWAATEQGDDFWRSPPRDPRDFARFMTAIVTRYRGAIRSWELWNEPDNRAYWLGDEAQFAALVRAGSAAVRAADPRAKVVLGGIATETSFLEALFERERIAPAVDVVNLHSYFETWHPDPIERLPEYVERVAEIVREHGEREPLWMAETGYSSVGGRAAVSDVYRARFNGEHTEKAQAAALVRTVVLALATEQLEAIAWYRINDLPAKQDVIGDDNNRHLGVRRADGAEKPAQRALTLLSGWFAEPFRVVEPRVRVEQGGGTETVVRSFARRSGEWLAAAWLAMPQAKAGAASGPVNDERAAVVRVALPGEGRGKVTAVGPTGAAWDGLRVEGSGAERAVVLSLRGGEVVLVRVAVK